MSPAATTRYLPSIDPAAARHDSGNMAERRWYYGDKQRDLVDCTCYVENCRSHSERSVQGVSAVVECPKHSSPELQRLRQRGLRTSRTYGRATADDEA
jgi:hypothetical protein